MSDAPAPPFPQPPNYGPPLTLAQAKLVMAAAEAEAVSNNWPMAIAIVDSTSHLVMLQKLDQTQLGSIQIAIEKAQTAVELRRSTRVIEEALAGGGLGLRLLSVRGVCALEGGVPLFLNGEVVGAIGASGMHSTMDGKCAEAGAAALRGIQP